VLTTFQAKPNSAVSALPVRNVDVITHAVELELLTA
jgi:hypothetical protein